MLKVILRLFCLLVNFGNFVFRKRLVSRRPKRTENCDSGKPVTHAHAWGTLLVCFKIGMMEHLCKIFDHSTLTLVVKENVKVGGPVLLMQRKEAYMFCY